MGTFDLLKDLVTLILKKSSTWSESRRSSVSFKTSHLTITFFKNTLTLQLQGSQATETSDFLVPLKKTEAIRPKTVKFILRKVLHHLQKLMGIKLTQIQTHYLSPLKKLSHVIPTRTLRKDQTLPSGLNWHQIIILVPHR